MSGIGQWTYSCSRLTFPASCDVCQRAVGRDKTPYYFYAPRGRPAQYRCYVHRFGRPDDVSSAKAPTPGTVPPGARWTDAGDALKSEW